MMHGQKNIKLLENCFPQSTHDIFLGSGGWGKRERERELTTKLFTYNNTEDTDIP